MSIFSRKEKVVLEVFCKRFYADNIFNESIGENDFNLGYATVVRNSIIEADFSFSGVKIEDLRYEIILLRIEMFSLAFLHKFGEKLSLAQTEYTWDYLRNKADSIWNDLMDYNKAIAQSNNLNTGLNTKTNKIYTAKLDINRIKLFDMYHAQGFDDVCIARMINRVYSETVWKNRKTIFYLTQTLCERLKCKLNEEAQFGLEAIIFGFYNGAMEKLNKIEIREQ